MTQMLEEKSQLHKNAEGKVQLTPNHSYDYQVQTQLLFTGFKFCDFFVWTEKDTLLETIRVGKTFCTVLLPEPVGKCFTNSIS